MGAISATKVKRTEFSGDYQLIIFTATLAAKSDTIDLSSYFDSIVGANAHLTGGMDDACQALQTSYDSTTVTVASDNAAGSDATDFTGTTIELWVVGVPAYSN